MSSARHAKHLVEIAETMTSKTVLVIGDIMLDRFIYGDATRISPESPVPVLQIKDETVMLGGAGNVLSNLSGLDVKTELLAVIGDDTDGQILKTLVRDKGAKASGLLVDPARPTTVKSRYLAAHQQLLRTDFETDMSLDKDLEAKLLKAADTMITRTDAVILSDYGKGVLSETVLRHIIASARDKNIPVLVDPKKADYSIYKHAHVITPNRAELSQATGNSPTKSDKDIVQTAQAMLEDSGIGAVIATRSQDGMTVMGHDPNRNKTQAPVHLRTEAVEVFDVSGAGDTVIATAGAALAAGASLVEAAAIANAAGGLVVAKVGTTPIRRRELITRLKDKSWEPGTKKQTAPALIDRAREGFLCDWDEAQETVLGWKRRGLRVGFTNGCFDILHSGHVTYLNAARERCDRLVIGLNADESVRRLKGKTRPVNDETARATVLRALGAVDMVVQFGTTAEEEDTPVSLIKRLKPDIYFKGGDYTEEDLPEAPVVRSYGGEVALMPLLEGHSTTSTIEKMKNEAA